MEITTDLQQSKYTKTAETTKPAGQTKSYFEAQARRAYQDKPIIGILHNYLQKNPNFPEWERLSKKTLSWSKCGNHLEINVLGYTQNKYCDNRACTICGNNKKHDHDKNYGEKLDQMILNPDRPCYLTTLTGPNCTAENLKRDIKQHAYCNQRFSKSYNKRDYNEKHGETYNANSALEITNNDKENTITYHVHTHTIHQATLDKNGKNDLQIYKPKTEDNSFEFKAKYFYKKNETLYTVENGEVIKHTYRADYGNKKDGYQACNLYYTNGLVNHWLKHNPEASIKGQNIKRCYNKKELVKYCTKSINTDKTDRKSGSKINPKAILTILNALHGTTTRTVYGTLRNRKNKNEIQNANDENIGNITEKAEVKSQKTDYQAGKYSKIITREKVITALTQMHLPIVDTETGELQLNQKGEPELLKVNTWEEIEIYTPDPKLIKRWDQLNNNYDKQLKQYHKNPFMRMVAIMQTKKRE